MEFGGSGGGGEVAKKGGERKTVVVVLAGNHKLEHGFVTSYYSTRLVATTVKVMHNQV